MAAIALDQIETTVADVLAKTQFIDMHTHLVPPTFGKLNLWGIDELLTYHYLEAEFFRSSDCSYEKYWSFSKQQRADAIWQALFVENSPVSEATRGIVNVLHAFGLPTQNKNLVEIRAFFSHQDVAKHVERVLQMAGVSSVVMTNDPLDAEEAPFWTEESSRHPQFEAVLRLDRILRGWPDHCRVLAQQGYAVDVNLTGKTISEVRRFIAEWCTRMHPVYMAVSLPYTFQFPDETVGTKLIAQAVLPSCRELNLPLSLMIGVRYQVNPQLRMAGDAVGRADLRCLENLCRDYPENRFLVSVLSRENQHELCVYCRKFSNLIPFGCWWFLNNPSIVEEITRERIELLGTSFIPQHSDARVLEQLIYKWKNTRVTLAPILARSYKLLLDAGGHVTRNDIERDIHRMFRGNFERWINGRTVGT